MAERKFVVLSDMTCDLPKDWYESTGAIPIPHAVIIDKKEYWDDFGATLPTKDVYKIIRNGTIPTTAHGNYEAIYNAFENACKAGIDALYVIFSSRLSGTFNVASMIANELMEKYPERKILCFDTKSASMGHGMLTMEAQKVAQSGAPIEDAVAMLEQKWDKVCHFFTVDDLNHLYRGGRLSKTTAFVGTVIGIKPIMNMDEDGVLAPINKIRGRKQAIEELVNLTQRYMSRAMGDTIYVPHGDCEEEADLLSDMLKSRLGDVKVVKYMLSPMIGVHAGPGTLAVIFWGEKRK